MKNFCCVADFNFLNRVTALDKSLKKYCDEYVLHLLCLDREIYENIKSNNIRTYLIEDLLKEDSLLEKSKNNNPSEESLINCNGDTEKARRLEFIWSLSAYFSWYCLENLNIEDILYIDSDIYFFDDWRKIYKNIKEKDSVGLVEHRCPYNPKNGKYNVGIVYFKNNFDGYKCATSWKNWLLLEANEFKKTHGSCGDQKYLELFPQLFQNVFVFDNFIGHLAPWNLEYHQYKDNKIIWNTEEQDLVYFHFSNFFPDFKNNTYIPAPRHGIIKLQNQFLKKIYDEYFQAMKEE